jgi:hypothetical protein
MIRVQMNDSQMLQGKLSSRSGSTFDLLEPGNPAAPTIDVTNVATVKKADGQSRRNKVKNAIFTVLLLAFGGAAVAVTGR